MTYEDALDYNEEANALRERIYDQGLLKATARMRNCVPGWKWPRKVKSA